MNNTHTHTHTKQVKSPFLSSSLLHFSRSEAGSPTSMQRRATAAVSCGLYSMSALTRRSQGGSSSDSSHTSKPLASRVPRNGTGMGVAADSSNEDEEEDKEQADDDEDGDEYEE